jgi:hypothetical protein
MMKTKEESMKLSTNEINGAEEEKIVKLYFDLAPDGLFEPELVDCAVKVVGEEVICRSAKHGCFVKFPKEDLEKHIENHNKANGPKE